MNISGLWRVGRVFAKLVPIVAALALLLVVIAWMAGTFEQKIPPGQSDVVRRRAEGQPVAQVHAVTKEYVEEAVGTLKAASRTVISARVLARISDILVDADDEVKQGQTLVVLEEGELRARLNQAEQTLKAAQETHAEAKRVFARVEELKKKNVVTQAEYDAASARLGVVEAEERRAEQAVAEATVMLSYTKIVAPKAGRIVDRLAEPGDMASPGQPLLTLYDPKTLRLEVPVAEWLAMKLSTGQKVKVRIDALNRELEGSVAQRVPQAEAASRSFLVKVALPEPEELFEGMFGRLFIPAGKRRHLCLPTSAIRTIGQLQFVDVVRRDNTLERRFIRTGRRGFPGRIEVLSGVEAGEVVLLHPEPARAEAAAR